MRVWGLGFRVWDVGSIGFRVWDLGFCVLGFRSALYHARLYCMKAEKPRKKNMEHTVDTSLVLGFMCAKRCTRSWLRVV